ncbi:hypothetical protein SAMN05444581_10761 [Methylocapsa palsarum]|uniref:Uncharacterized protein n=1 Tax=Methylocapsa palsarum TaxID=1612308 RepID=A0A1I3Z4A8_9HYPH|nr:hypothetical protein SAMN05444581_10761 [Methylocapsa palsarum]
MQGPASLGPPVAPQADAALDALVRAKHRPGEIHVGCKMAGFGGLAKRFYRSPLAAAMFAVLTTSAFHPANARPLVPAERQYIPSDGLLPPCDDPAALERLQSRFHERESEFWRTGLEILGFDQVQEIGFRSNGLDYIPRRYCRARAYMNDDKWRPVSFTIVKDAGLIGAQDDVDWCVEGLDRMDAYAPGCKMVRP